MFGVSVRAVHQINEVPCVVENTINVNAPFPGFDLPVAPVAVHFGDDFLGTDLGENGVYRRIEKLRFATVGLIG
ncbi:MAG: hypothetical protein ACLFPV_11065, partial [Spirochaetaceae bacterium]